MPTIKDIAREAGVSHGTVSNVLNKTGKVSVKKIKLVEEAAKRLGYVPNAQAQLLRQGAPTSVIVIVPSLKEDIYLDLFTSVQKSMLVHNYDTAVYTTEDIQGNEELLLERLRISSIAAIITVSSLSDVCCRYYSAAPCPVVYVDREPACLRRQDSFVSFDYGCAKKELWEHIKRNNWKSLAFFTSPDTKMQPAKLISELQQEALQNQINAQIFSSDYSLALNKAFDIVQSSTAFDAIITSSSFRAESIFSVLQLLHIEDHPQIVTLSSLACIHGHNANTYALDYGQAGFVISNFLIAHFQDKVPLPHKTLLPAKGFSFHFPSIQTASAQKLTMLTLDTPSSTALKKLLPLFEAVSGIEVKLICLPYEDLHTQINLIGPGFSYDLIRMDVAKFDSLGQKIYLPLEESRMSREGLPQKLFESGYKSYSLLNDTMYALPFDPSVQIYLYRKDLFEDATLSRAYYERYHESLSVPATMEQHLRIAEFFTRQYNPDSPTEFGTTTTRGSANSTASDFLPFFLSKVDHIYDDHGHIAINTPEMVQAIEQYQELSRYSCNQRWWAESIQQFADGVAATSIVYSNYASTVINSKHSSVVGKVGAAVIPGKKPLLGGGVIGISRYSKQSDACQQFFNWYYSPDISSMLVQLGGTSPIIDTYDNFKNYSIFPWLSTSKTSFGLGTRGSGNADLPNFSIGKYEFAIGTVIRNVLNGDTTAKEAALMAQTMYDSACANERI